MSFVKVRKIMKERQKVYNKFFKQNKAKFRVYDITKIKFEDDYLKKQHLRAGDFKKSVKSNIFLFYYRLLYFFLFYLLLLFFK